MRASKSNVYWWHDIAKDDGVEPWIAAQRVDRESAPSGYVYFIDSGDAIKIGISKDPEGRLKQLQSAHWRKLIMLGAMQGFEYTEIALHKKFAEHSLAREWFARVAPIQAFISQHGSPLYRPYDNDNEE